MARFKDAHVKGDKNLHNKHLVKEYTFTVYFLDGEISTLKTGKIFYDTAVRYSIDIVENGLTLFETNTTYPPHMIRKVCFKLEEEEETT